MRARRAVEKTRDGVSIAGFNYLSEETGKPNDTFMEGVVGRAKGTG